MENQLDHLYRYTKPTGDDKVPFGTRWTYHSEDDQQKEYVQISRESMKPEWVRLGDLLESYYREYFDDRTYLLATIEDYKNKQ